MRDAVLLNAAAAIAAATPEHAGLEERLSEGLEAATASLDSGAAAGALARLVEVSRAPASHDKAGCTAVVSATAGTSARCDDLGWEAELSGPEHGDNHRW